jgi:hypothetical protein
MMELERVPSLAQRGAADLRGAAGRAARSRPVRRCLRASGRQLQRAERSAAALARAVTELGHAAHHAHVADASCAGSPPLTMLPRTANVLLAVMAVCDWTIASVAFQAGDRDIGPLASYVLAGGIGLTLVFLGKKAGERLATFRRLDDEAARWAVLVAIAMVVVAIAPVGLTLLRVAPPWSWPFLLVSAPVGSAALTWTTHNPHRQHADRLERVRRRRLRRARRIDQRLTRRIAGHDRARTAAEQRFRARLGGGLRRAILDGAVANDLGGQQLVLRQLAFDHLPSSYDETRRLRQARAEVWAEFAPSAVQLALDLEAS